MHIEQQILETWMINHRTNVLLMNHLTKTSLDYGMGKRGGGKIGHQLAHMYNVRYWKLETIDKSLIKDLRTIKSKDDKSIEILKEVHEHSARLILEVFKEGIDNDGMFRKGWKRGVLPLLGYFIHHDAHHRGNILLTLKLSEFVIPDALKYGIWEWQKI